MNVLDADVQAESHDADERTFFCRGPLADGTLCGKEHSWERKPTGWALLPTALGWKSFILIACDKCHRWHIRLERPERAENIIKEKA